MSNSSNFPFEVMQQTNLLKNRADMVSAFLPIR